MFMKENGPGPLEENNPIAAAMAASTAVSEDSMIRLFCALIMIPVVKISMIIKDGWCFWANS
jgi:hypothetical protein